jgi:hypothetical protein
MELLGHTPDYSNTFNDKRLSRRANQIAYTLLMGRSSSVHGNTSNEADQKGFYRFLANDKVKESALINELTNRCSINCNNRDVLVIQDTSSIGLSHRAKSIKQESGLGMVGNKTGLGFLAHISLVLDQDRETMLGFSDVELWHRTEDKANNTTGKYKKQSIEEKESYKWIKASESSKNCLKQARHITVIEDREGDIYEQFCLIPDKKTQLVIRSRDNRALGDGTKLHQALREQKPLGDYTIIQYGDIRKNTIKREIAIEVRIKNVLFKKPKQCKNKNLPDQLSVYVVEAKEKDKANGLCWRLITTKKTETFDQAKDIIEKYKMRWYIEQLFRLLKKQGYQIESTELESGWSIRKLFVMVLNAALRVMQLYLAYDNEDSQDISEVFKDEEIKCLNLIELKLRKTEKTINPFNPKKLAWASWIIARLGGWKGNAKQRRAGPIIIKRGIDAFENMFEGWQLSKL